MEGLPFCSAFTWNSLARLLLAVLLGGAIGLEREFRGRPAGLRTHILVCLGATILMIAWEGMPDWYRTLSPGSRVTLDPGRIAAGIITGIGFLGAGAIIRIGDLVRGLTTAGCIWFVAALGIVIGEGFYVLAIASTAIVLLSLMALSRVEHHIQPIVYRSIVMVASVAQVEALEKKCRALLEEQEIKVQDIAHKLLLESGRAEVTFKVRTRHQLQGGAVLRTLAALPGVMEAHWH
ncbi:MAG: MgtC/SapB family protein [candidate division NC10 bacterium]|nr:MgtC/SapB family protein [candidate division NC10 bacterium]